MTLLLSHVFDLVADALDGITRTVTYLLGHITGRMTYFPSDITRGMANRSTNPLHLGTPCQQHSCNQQNAFHLYSAHACHFS